MNADMKKVPKIPSIRRLANYLHLLKKMREDSKEHVSTTLLAKETHLEPIVVRKDLEITGISGQPGVGYRVDHLIAAIEKFIGWNNTSEAFIVGAGSLGRALLGYKGFESHGLKVLAAFDCDPSKTDTEIHGVPVFEMEKLPNLAARLNIRMAILCVPEKSAQSCADMLVSAGIKGIWNFSPVNLKVPAGVVVQNEDLASSLAVLSFKLSKNIQRAAEEAAANGVL